MKVFKDMQRTLIKRISDQSWTCDSRHVNFPKSKFYEWSSEFSKDFAAAHRTKENMSVVKVGPKLTFTSQTNQLESIWVLRKKNRLECTKQVNYCKVLNLHCLRMRSSIELFSWRFWVVTLSRLSPSYFFTSKILYKKSDLRVETKNELRWAYSSDQKSRWTKKATTKIEALDFFLIVSIHRVVLGTLLWYKL